MHRYCCFEISLNICAQITQVNGGFQLFVGFTKAKDVMYCPQVVHDMSNLLPVFAAKHHHGHILSIGKGV